LRNDEYIQMAGRAGRRGKDDKGVVIYLPDHEPATPQEIFTMMKGKRPPIISRMDFHYDFILKTIQASQPNEPLKWLQIMEQSYWFQQRKKEIEQLRQELHACTTQMKEIEVAEPYFSECKKRSELEQQIKQTVNAARKEVQRKLDTVKNKQLGPKWNKAWADYHLYSTLQKQTNKLQLELTELENHKDTIRPSIEFLYEIGYLTNCNPATLTVSDLTVKGILATEVNEGHPILMTELYTRQLLHELSGDELVTVLACFMEKKSNADDHHTHPIVLTIDKIAAEYMELELQYMENPEYHYWSISTEMMEPMRKWMEGVHASVICAEHGLFEGNFIRCIMKTANMLDEWLAMATYCQHIEQVDKVMEVRQRVVRDVVSGESLYLRL